MCISGKHSFQTSKLAYRNADGLCGEGGKRRNEKTDYQTISPCFLVGLLLKNNVHNTLIFLTFMYLYVNVLLIELCAC